MADELLLENDAISTAEIFETNQKSYNEVYLQTIAKDIFEFTTNQQEIIANIADQCPLTGGRAVLNARAIRSFYEQVQYDDTKCQRTEERNYDNKLQQDEVSELEFYVFPNPAKDLITISLNQPLNDNTVLLVSDMLGNNIIQRELKAGISNVEVGVQQLTSGVYTVHIFNEQGLTTTSKKITILK